MFFFLPSFKGILVFLSVFFVVGRFFKMPSVAIEVSERRSNLIWTFTHFYACLLIERSQSLVRLLFD
jgi:hypothetical protein